MGDVALKKGVFDFRRKWLKYREFGIGRHEGIGPRIDCLAALQEVIELRSRKREEEVRIIV